MRTLVYWNFLEAFDSIARNGGTLFAGVIKLAD